MGLSVRHHSTSIRAASRCNHFSVRHMQIVLNLVYHKVSEISTIYTHALKECAS